MLECLWAWMAESSVPHFCGGAVGFALGVTVELVAPCEESTPSHFLRNILKNKLVMAICEEGKD